MTETINDILKGIDEAIAAFQENVPVMQRRVYDELQVLVKELGIKNGRLIPNIENLKAIGRIKNKLERILRDSRYSKATEAFAESFDHIADLNQKYFTSYRNNFQLNKFLPAMKELAIEGTVNDLLGQGLNNNVIEPVLKILNQNVTTGGSYADFQEELRNHILTNDTGEGSLERYTKQITTDSINQFNAQYHNAIAQDLKFNWGRYIGSNITTTREFCFKLTEMDWVHRSELPEIIKGNINGYQCKLSKSTKLPLGMIPGTNSDNFNVRRGGYNCGHQFFWVPDLAVPANIRSRIKIAA